MKTLIQPMVIFVVSMDNLFLIMLRLMGEI